MKKKFINVIVLTVFISGLFTNYSYAHDLSKSINSKQNLKLVSAFMKGQIKEELFDEFNKVIEGVSGE
ncbi:hypothetical protein ACFL5N_02875, partial [bacterium]